ncbi:MAG: HAD family hydrolase [Deltaproteobacteria bacterium]|nr:HAD family hydrolase [Deltaproteobacteria bacterium]
MAVRRAVFLDRDGTLNREVGYLRTLAELELLPGVSRALLRLGEAGFLRLVVTNQSGIARGYFDRAFVEETHEELRRRLREEGADVEEFLVCPHHPDHTGPCGCRKPSPGLLQEAAARWDLDLAASWVVGDKPADIGLARAAGCRAALVRTGYGAESEAELEGLGLVPDVVAADLEAAVREIVTS